jgi:TldD protein
MFNVVPMERRRGYETIEMLDLVPRASKLAKEAAELLKAPECPKGRTTLILGGDIAQLQVHESCGHPIELDAFWVRKIPMPERAF